MARKVDFDPFKIHFTRNQSEEGGGAWRMARKRVKWIYPKFLYIVRDFPEIIPFPVQLSLKLLERNLYPSFIYFMLGPFINYVDRQGGEGILQMSTPAVK